MKPEDWNELEDILAPENNERGRELIKKTESIDEHPEGYNGPCLCKMCMSYADV